MKNKHSFFLGNLQLDSYHHAGTYLPFPFFFSLRLLFDNYNYRFNWYFSGCLTLTESLNLPKEGYSIASNISVDAGLNSPLPLLGSQAQLLKAVCVLEYLKTCSLSLGGTTCTIQIIQFGVDYTIWGGGGTTIRPSFSLT